MINTNWPSRIHWIWFKDMNQYFSYRVCFRYKLKLKWWRISFGLRSFLVFFRIYKSLYELSVEDDVIGSEGSANGQTKVDNWEGFVKISPEILYGLWYDPSYYDGTLRLTVHQTLINYISRFDDDICFWVNLGNLKNLFLQNPYSKSMLTNKLFSRICLYFCLHFEIKMTTKFLKWLFWARFFYWTIKQYNYSFFSHWESFNLVFG